MDFRWQTLGRAADEHPEGKRRLQSLFGLKAGAPYRVTEIPSGSCGNRRMQMVRGASVRDREYRQVCAKSFGGANHLQHIIEEARIVVREALSVGTSQASFVAKTKPKKRP
jgi:hypothetical protein